MVSSKLELLRFKSPTLILWLNDGLVQAGLHCVCPHFVSLCMDLKLHKVFVKLTDRNIRGGATEEELVEMGRTWLLVVIYSHM
jgi:hypothetical protein